MARSDEKLVYPKRKLRMQQDWLRMPVGGINRDDAEAYAAWLDQSGRLPGAHLCTEQEWERAARGADSRDFPHGDNLEPDDANIDETYGKDPSLLGPDEVGAHPLSGSPFGVQDLAGNVNEWVRSTVDASEPIMRSGAFMIGGLAALIVNRQIVAPAFRDSGGGTRICSPPPR